jgi:hypothetical protein
MHEDIKREAHREEFEKLADERAPGSFAQLWDFLRNNKKWWLSPIIAILLLFGALIVLSSTAAAPFIYTLF